MHVHRWKTAEPVMERVAETRREIWSIYCNDTHAFCGQDNGTIAVFNLKSGELERELEAPEGAMGPLHLLHGGEEVVAAALGPLRVVVWSSQGEMEQLHLYNVESYNCSEVSCDHGELSKQIRSLLVVDRNKVAILLRQFRANSFSLILLEKVQVVWECKSLGCFPGDFPCGSLVSDGAWLALVVEGEEKIRLWHGSNGSRQEICLPESVHNLVSHSMRGVCMFIEIPHIIFYVRGEVRVLKMAATQLHLVKTIRIPGCSAPRRTIHNKFCLGFLQWTNGDHIVHVFQKRELFDPDLSPDQTEGRRIEVDGSVNINTTSLLWQRREEEGGVPVWMGLVKKDFWI